MYLQFTFSNSQTMRIQRIFWQILFFKGRSSDYEGTFNFPFIAQQGNHQQF